MPALTHRSFIGAAAMAATLMLFGAATTSSAEDVPHGQGESVSASNLNAKKNVKTRMIVGAPYTTNSNGAAIIFERTDKGTWKQTAKLTPSTQIYAQAGRSVSMSADGTRVIVGAPGDCVQGGSTGTYTPANGCAYLYKLVNNTWTLSFTMMGLYQGESFGYAVHITPDGNKIFVGAPDNAGGKGAVYAFDIAGSNKKLINYFTTSDSSASHFGISLSSSEKGEYLLIGADRTGSGVGAAWVYTPTAGGEYNGHYLNGTKLVGTGGIGPVQGQGHSVAMNKTGDILVLGAPADDSYKGSAFVFARNSSGAWEQKAQLKDAAAAADSEFGATVGLAADTSGTVVVSEPYYRNEQAGIEGKILMFTKPKKAWTYGEKPGASNTQCKGLGESLAVAPDASLMLAGAPQTTDTAGQYTGATCYFEKSKNSWSMKGKPIIAK